MVPILGPAWLNLSRGRWLMIDWLMLKFLIYNLYIWPNFSVSVLWVMVIIWQFQWQFWTPDLNKIIFWQNYILASRWSKGRRRRRWWRPGRERFQIPTSSSSSSPASSPWSSWAWHRWSSLVGLRAWCFDASSTSGAPCSFSGDIVLVLLLIIIIAIIIIIIATIIITIINNHNNHQNQNGDTFIF